MRLLFDEQLAERPVGVLTDVYPDSLHVRELGIADAPDSAVWRAATEHDCVLVTKDEDFHRLSVLHGAPPKAIWLRAGNCTKQQIAELLRLREDLIRDFAGQDDATVHELGAPAIGR